LNAVQRPIEKNSSKKSALTMLLSIRRAALDLELSTVQTFKSGQMGQAAGINVTTSTCGFRPVGCGLQVEVNPELTAVVTPAPDHPVNRGTACPKGWEALAPLAASNRTTVPCVRNSSGELAPVNWDTAMRKFAEQFKAIQRKFGPDAIAWLCPGQLCTEELAFLGALAKFGLGLLHGDGDIPAGMEGSILAYERAFGFDAPPYTFADLEHSDVIVLIGLNLRQTHPVLWERVLRNRNYPEIIAVDPRKTETALSATQHLALRPKSELALLGGIANLLLQTGTVAHEFIAHHTSGIEQFREFARGFSLDKTAAATGLTMGELYHFMQSLVRGKAVSFWWPMELNQGHDGARTAHAILNLALLTGNIGRPGTGPNSLPGHSNAMGLRLFGNTTNLLGGHDFLNPQQREKVVRTLNLPAACIPSKVGWSYPQILEGIADNRIKGLWVADSNAAPSWGEADGLHELLGQLDFLVVQGMGSPDGLMRHAHLFLPTAGWGEKEGTFVNAERRIGLARKVAQAPGQSLSDFDVLKLVAHFWGCAGMFNEWTSPEAVFQILKRLTRGQPCDFTGIQDYRMLEQAGGVQWPCPAHCPDVRADGASQAVGKPAVPRGFCANSLNTSAPAIERRLFAEGQFFHPDGRARFITNPNVNRHSSALTEFRPRISLPTKLASSGSRR
jgi:predicted molibdopterin-dependent oxidoreductase YjgC